MEKKLGKNQKGAPYYHFCQNGTPFIKNIKTMSQHVFNPENTLILGLL